jgi:peptidoglycan/xylan/chitin deacetylase (PgdA/CDA1 family)
VSLLSLVRPLAAAVRVSAAALANPIDPPIVLLLYHRVTTLASDHERLAVVPERFRAQLQVLKQALPVLRLEADWRSARRPAAVVTFDDGYADNLLEALPILESEEVPATFFITTGNVASGEEFWWDQLERLIVEAGAEPPRELRRPAGPARPSDRSAEARFRLYQEVHPRMKRMDSDQRERVLAALRAASQVPAGARASHRPLTVDELRRLAASPWVTIGAHGVSHTALSALPPARQRSEILDSRHRLETWIGRDVRVFSFPFGGREDITPHGLEACREAGFAKTVLNLPGTVRRWSDPHRLPRHLVRDWDADAFRRHLRRFLLT